MNTKAKAFIAAAMVDEQAQKTLKAQPRPKDAAEAEAVLRQTILPLAANMGFELTLEDFEESELGPVDDSEISAISGGYDVAGKLKEFFEDLREEYTPDPDMICVCSCIGYGYGYGE